MSESEKSAASSSSSSTAITMPEVTEHWLTVAGISTQVLKCGSLQPGRPLMLIIPGNPGVADYYEEFMYTLYDQGAQQMAVWTISHAGHVAPPSHVKPQWPEYDVYSVQGQTYHKMEFLNDYVPPDIPLILVGHSIGAYIILKIMEVINFNRIMQGVLLFPTIERMAESPKGTVATPLLKYFRWLVPMAAVPLHYLVPMRMKSMITNFVFRNQEVPSCALKATLRIVSPFCASNICYMGATEMDGVVEADHDIINKYCHKLMFYYGADDPWCPPHYHEEMKMRHPEADICVCPHKFEHAFVLESSKEMGVVLFEWLKRKLPDQFVD